MKQTKNWILNGLLAVMLAGIASCAPSYDAASSTNLHRGMVAYGGGDYVTAFAEWTPIAEAGDSIAQYFIGEMYSEGKGVAQNYSEAAKWYRLSAEGGYSGAQFGLGLMYATGNGVAHNDAEAVKWWRRAAEAGRADAQYFLGQMYAEGRGVEQNDAIAVKLYRLAAEAGSAYAQNELGMMYAEGWGVPQDERIAYVWFNLAVKQGLEQSTENRNRMTKNMTAAQLIEAQEMLRQCIARRYKGC